MDVNSKNGSEGSLQTSSLAPPVLQQRPLTRLREQAILFQVLDNPSLREEILKHAIFGKDGVDRRAACNLRLVNSSWNDSVLRTLWKAHEHLLTLVIGGYLDNFRGNNMETFATDSGLINESSPPLKLDISGYINNPENLDRMSNALDRCGSHLVRMKIYTHEIGRPLQNLLPNWTLPRLQKLEITVILGAGDRVLLPPDKVVIEPEKVNSYMINSIVSGATTLTKLVISSPVPPARAPRHPLPILESVTFPSTLAEIVINGKIAGQDLELPTAPQQYSLTSLTLSANTSLFENGLFFRILDNWRHTLKSLAVTKDAAYMGPPRDAKMIGFPVMEQLKELSISSMRVELEDGTSYSLRKSFKKLRSLQLRPQTIDMFRKWTEQSKFESVTSLEVILADEREAENNVDEFFVSVNSEAMRMANSAFPNLRKLELGVSKEDTSGLEYVFQEMRQLKELKIRVCSVKSEKSTKVWDSILTGVPIKMIGVSKKQLYYLAKIEHEAENAASIKNLQELVRFSLVDCRKLSWNPRTRYSIPKPYFSDFTFSHALLKMPKLASVDACFQASDDVRTRWLSEGRAFL